MGAGPDNTAALSAEPAFATMADHQADAALACARAACSSFGLPQWTRRLMASTSSEMPTSKNSDAPSTMPTSHATARINTFFAVDAIFLDDRGAPSSHKAYLQLGRRPCY